MHVLNKSDSIFDINSPDYKNESPLFVPAKSNEWSNDEMYSILYPRKLWRIGELVSENNETISNYNDVCIIEMFIHSPEWAPDSFLDFDKSIHYITNNEFFDGQALFLSGFPIIKNDYDFTPFKNFNQSTVIQRELLLGVCKFIDNEPVVNLHLPEVSTEKLDHRHLNGMSGGAVFNVVDDGSEPWWCGMILTGGNGIVRFIPAEVLIPAIANYQAASSCIMDPNGVIEPALEVLEYFMQHSYK